jgi:hypothetical protein
MLHYSVPYFICALIIAFLGVNRKMGFWGYFFSSLMLTPVMGILLLLASDAQPRQTTAPELESESKTSAT